MSFREKYLLAWKLIQPKKWQYFLVLLGIGLGTMFVFIFFTLTQGVKHSFEIAFADADTLFTLQSNPSSPPLDDTLIQELQTNPNIQNVYKETSLLIPATVNITMPFIDDFIVDVYFIRGIEDELFYALSGKQKPENETVAVLLDPLSLEILNTFLSNFLSGTTLSSGFFEQKQFTASFGTSSYLPSMNEQNPQEKKTVIQGFSIFAPLLGVALPYSEVEKMQQHFGQTTNTYSRLYVEPKNPIMRESIMQNLEQRGFKANNPSKGLSSIFSLITTLQIVLISASSIIIILSLLFLFSTLNLSLREHQKTIGILRAMGESKTNIQKIFLIQAGTIALLGGIFGIIGAGVLLAMGYFSWESISPSSLLSSSVFIPQFWTSTILLCCIGICASISIIVPLRNTMKKDPLLLLLE